MANSQTTKTIIVRVDAGDSDRSLKNISRSMGDLNKRVGDIQGSFSKLRGLFNAAAGLSIFGFGIREVVQVADSFTQLQSRILAFSGSAEKTSRIFSDLVKLADETKTSVEGIAGVFARVQVATSRLNITSEAQIAIAKVLQNSFRLSGASAAEASSATIQLTQSLSSGQLRGQELRAILESNGVLAQIFAERAEKAGLSVFKFAEAGRFTNKEVFSLLAENFDKINTKAGELSQTFEQTLTLATNRLKVKIGELNTEFDVNGKFAKAVDFLIKNGEELSIVIGGALAGFAIPALVTAVVGLVGFLSPFVVLLGAAGVVLAKLVFQFDKVADTVSGAFKVALLEVNTLLLDSIEGFEKFLKFFGIGLPDALQKTKIGVSTTIQEISKELVLLDDAIQDGALSKKFSRFSQFPTDGGEFASSINAIEEAAKSGGDRVRTLAEQIGDLQVRFNLGKIGVVDFNKRLEALKIKELNQKLAEGVADLTKYNKEIRELKLEAITREFEFGAISIDGFNEKIRQFKIEEVNRKFREGKVTVAEFTNELIRLQQSGFLDKETYTNGVGAGIANYIESIGTLSSQIAQATERTFSALENSIFEATKKGRLDFAAFTQGVLDDLLKIAIRTAIVKPLAEGLLGGIFSGGGGATAGAVAGINGPGIAGPSLGGGGISVTPFAKGGVVDSPTAFGFNGGLGIAGEAGPEAILPLSRNSDGNLGVNAKGLGVTVNVINNTGSEVSTRETTGANGERALEILIETKVKDGIAKGRFDKTMKSSYGLNRQGS